jgi:hypothetical protein
MRVSVTPWFTTRLPHWQRPSKAALVWERAMGEGGRMGGGGFC